MEFRRSDHALQANASRFESTLQLYWFGSGCHLIQLGDARVLTDPFVTNEFNLTSLASDPERVAKTLARIPVPDVVLINHSHHDHILDAYAAMSQESWQKRQVPLYGGQSSKNLIAGWDDDEVNRRCHAIEDGGGFVVKRTTPQGYQIKITAYPTKHSPHLNCGYTLADGLIRRPRESIPRNLFDFQAGEVFNYLIELRRGRISFNVFYLGSPYDLRKMNNSVPPADSSIDVAVMLAPSAENVRGYPQEHLERLRPKHIVLSHFNNFFREDPDEQLSLFGIDLIQMPKLVRSMQSVFARTEIAYQRFERMHVPALTVFEENGRARNVIRIR